VLFQNAFTSYPNTEITLFLLESRIPESFFYILITQFFLILTDRVVYLFRSIKAKVCVEYNPLCAVLCCAVLCCAVLLELIVFASDV
jgi:hypothetical protein